MIVILNNDITSDEIGNILDKLRDFSLDFHLSKMGGKQVMVITNVPAEFDLRKIKMLDGVLEVVEVTEPFKLASRRWKKETSVFDINGIEVGGNTITMIAGPCAVESEEQIFAIAEILHKHNIKFIRGGAYKPRTSP